MRTLKNVFLYGCDFLRMLLIKFPVYLFTTNRGRIILVGLTALAIALSGLHFWSSSQTHIIYTPDQIEKIIAENNFEHKVIFSENKIDYYQTKFYSSPQEFLAALEPGEQILVNYYLEEIKQLKEDESETNLVKVYRGREGNQEIAYREAFSGIPSNSRVEYYTADSLTVVGLDKDMAIGIWVAGGVIWLFTWFLIAIASDWII